MSSSPAHETTPRVRALWQSLRWLVVATAALWLTATVDWAASWSVLSHADLIPLLAALALTLATVATNALRWQLLLTADGVAPSLGVLCRLHLAGMFASNFLPTSFGGDAYRAYLLGRLGYSYGRAAASVAVDRAIGAAVLFAMALGGALIFVATPGPREAAAALALGLALAVVALLCTATLPAFAAILEPLPLLGRACSLLRAGTIYFHPPGRVLPAVALSIVGNAAVGVNGVLFARAVVPDASALEVGLASLIVVGLSALPLSINGLGVAEAAWLILLTRAGLEGAAAAAVAVLWRTGHLAVSLLGGVLVGTPPKGEPRRSERAPE